VSRVPERVPSCVSEPDPPALEDLRDLLPRLLDGRATLPQRSSPHRGIRNEEHHERHSSTDIAVCNGSSQDPKAQHRIPATISKRPNNTRSNSIRSPPSASPNSVALPSGRAPNRIPWFPVPAPAATRQPRRLQSEGVAPAASPLQGRSRRQRRAPDAPGASLPRAARSGGR
jgi:hypothetical protein